MGERHEYRHCCWRYASRTCQTLLPTYVHHIRLLPCSMVTCFACPESPHPQPILSKGREVGSKKSHQNKIFLAYFKKKLYLCAPIEKHTPYTVSFSKKHTIHTQTYIHIYHDIEQLLRNYGRWRRQSLLAIQP